MKTKRSQKNTIRSAITLAALLTLSACQEADQTTASAPPEAAPNSIELKSAEWEGLARLHSFGDIHLAGQPQPEAFEEAKKAGVKTVINMRHIDENKDFDEESIVSGLGMKYISLPWNGADELTDEIFDRSRELLNTAERPVLLHCSSANRVGAVWIPWRVLDNGGDLEQAGKEAAIIGIKTPEYEPKAIDYIKRNQQ